MEYRPTYLDRVTFTLIHQFLSPITNGFFVLFAALVFATVRGRHDILVRFITALMLYLCMWIAQAIYVVVHFLTCRHDPALSDHVLTLHDDGVLDVTEFGEWRIFWKGVQRIAVRPGFVAVYIGPAMAFLIPGRAFSSREAKTAFIAELNARLKRACPT